MSETSPRPLHTLMNDSSQETITSFAHLLQTLKEHPEFAGYRVSHRNTFAFNLQRDDLNKIFINASACQDEGKLAPFLLEAAKNHTCLLCVGSEAEVNAVVVDDKENFHRVALPLSFANLRTLLASFHKLQSAASVASHERQRIFQESEEVKYVLSISRELNGERNIPKLLNLILRKAREVTRADAGSIYTVDTPDHAAITSGTLHFRFTQNDSIKQNLSEFVLPINDKSVVGNAVIHSQTIKIPDLYKLSDNPKENPFGVTHDRSWDQRIGYESRSMLTMPMFDISHSVIGVIQLINCKKDPNKRLKNSDDFRDQVVPFDDQLVEYAEIVAQQAGIALENAKMQDDIQKLFDGFVNASVTAIELRDPTTSGHSHRVAKLTLELARIINREKAGRFGSINFNEDQMREIEYASLLHDFGKLGVREHVLVKAKKLYPDQFRLIQERFRLIRSMYEIEYLHKCRDYMQHPEMFPMGISVDSFKLDRDKKLEELETFFEFICKANEPTVLEQGGFELLRDIANCHFNDPVEKGRPFLLPLELKALSVSRGSLTADEFSEIQSHVTHTYEFLRKIPWGRRLANVPQIAAKHHEKLDGSGYPTSAASEDIPLQSRMMTIADIYDALTASDRPYKKAVPVERALDIIHMEVKGGKLDKALFDMFLDAKVYKIVSDG